MQVTKEEFEAFIKNYDGPGGLYSHEIGFTTPSSTIYCDFGIASYYAPWHSKESRPVWCRAY